MEESHSRISYLPTDGLTYDPSDSKYWDQEALDKEIERTFEICHGCRMCFKYCDSFPNLFNLLDNKYNGDVKKIKLEDTIQIMDACFQCKLCEVQCPYTIRDGHEFKMDFPKLVHRHKAIHSKDKPRTLRDKILGDPDKSAGMARASFGLANLMNRYSIPRWFMEKIIGIH